MKINRLFIATFIAASTFFVACDEYEDSVAKSPTVSSDNAAVRFADDNVTPYEVEKTTTGFDLVVIRNNASSALEASVEVVENTDESFVIPSTLSFAAGEDTVILTVNIDYTKAPVGKDLSFSIRIADNYANPYLVEYPEYYGKIIILDWQKYSAGTYYSQMFDASWTQDLYRALGTDKYRFFDLYAEGYPFTFNWDGGVSIVPDGELDANGYYLFVTGYMHPSHGLITVHIDSDKDYTFYNASTDAFQFEGKWTVSAGSFGWKDDTYTITSRY